MSKGDKVKRGHVVKVCNQGDFTPIQELGEFGHTRHAVALVGV